MASLEGFVVHSIDKEGNTNTEIYWDLDEAKVSLLSAVLNPDNEKVYLGDLYLVSKTEDTLIQAQVLHERINDGHEDVGPVGS